MNHLKESHLYLLDQSNASFMDPLLKAIKLKTNISDDLENDIRRKFVKKTLNKGDLLLKDGQYCRHFFFLNEGVVRTFYLNKGKDITSWIYKDNHFFTSWYSFYQEEASFENIEAVSDCDIYFITNEDFETLVEAHTQFSNFTRMVIQEQLSIADLYFKGYWQMSAKEKYLQLLSFFPDIELHLKLGDIASYLGISQETLSRIRAEKSFNH